MTCYHEILVPILKPLRKKISPQNVYGLGYFCPRINHPSPEDQSVFWPTPKRSNEVRWQVCCLLPSALGSLSWVLMPFSPNKAIRTLTYDCAVRWDPQGVTLGAELGSMVEKVGWAILLAGFYCFPHRALCLSPGLLTNHEPANCPLAQGVQVDPGGRESHWSRISSYLGVPTLSPFLCLFPVPCIPSVPSGSAFHVSSP